MCTAQVRVQTTKTDTSRTYDAKKHINVNGKDNYENKG